MPLLAKCPDRVNYPDFHATSEDHAAWIINLQTGRLASGVSVVHNKQNCTCPHSARPVWWVLNSTKITLNLLTLRERTELWDASVGNDGFTILF
jgi:hypothetical protein